MADIANTALYIHEGDAWNAIMCGIAAIPGIGDLASLARKSYNVFKTSKTGIKVINALKKYEGVEKILSSLQGKMKTGAKGLNKLSESFESLFDRIKNLLKHICIKMADALQGIPLSPQSMGIQLLKKYRKVTEYFPGMKKLAGLVLKSLKMYL